MRKPGKIVIAAAAAFALSACSPFNEEPSDQPPGSDTAPTIASAASSAPSGANDEHGEHVASDECTAEDFKVEGASGQKPKVTVPKDCAAPTKLLSFDLDKGDGKAIAKGGSAEMHYTLYAFSTGKALESSFDSGQAFPLENIGEAGVIAGWNEGLIGLKEGGRRLLVVPPDKGYGADPSHELAKETLVFVVGAVRVS